MTVPRHPMAGSRRQHCPGAAARPAPLHEAQDAGNSWGWHVVDALITLCGGHTHGLGKTARGRVTAALLLLGATLVVLATFIAVMA